MISRAEPFVPTNLYPTERLPSYMNRVAVLPCFYPDMDSSVLEFADDILGKNYPRNEFLNRCLYLPVS